MKEEAKKSRAERQAADALRPCAVTTCKELSTSWHHCIPRTPGFDTIRGDRVRLCQRHHTLIHKWYRNPALVKMGKEQQLRALASVDDWPEIGQQATIFTELPQKRNPRQKKRKKNKLPVNLRYREGKSECFNCKTPLKRYVCYNCGWVHWAANTPRQPPEQRIKKARKSKMFFRLQEKGYTDQRGSIVNNYGVPDWARNRPNFTT